MCCVRDTTCARAVGAVGDQEDEEAFLEGITNAPALHLPHLAVKIRSQTDPTWSPAVLLKPGKHQAGLSLHPAHPVCMLCAQQL